MEREQERTSSIQRRFNALVKESSVVYELLDPDGTLVYISESSEKVIGYKPEERLGKKIYDYYNEEEKQKLSSMVGLVLSEPNQKVQMDIIFKSKGGKDLYLDVYMENFLHDPAIGGIVVNFRDITSRVKMEKSIRHLSLHDDLTGLPNNRSLKKKLEVLCQHGRKGNKGFAVFMLDIDSYKSISDTLGYQLGERLIIEIARRLKLYCGRTKSLYRYSGDHFVIIVENEPDTKQNEKEKSIKKHMKYLQEKLLDFFLKLSGWVIIFWM